jgi:hypothetical protein
MRGDVLVSALSAALLLCFTASAAEPPAPPAPAGAKQAPYRDGAAPKAAADEAKADDAKAKDEKEEEEPKDTCRWCHHGKLGEAWTLPQPHVLKDSGITASGWVESGFFTNAYGAGLNGPLGFDNLTGFNLHQMVGVLEKKTDTEKKCWDLGGRVDYMFGIDGPDSQAIGDRSWDFGWNSSPDYGSAIPQMYLELAFGDWSIKGGRFWTPVGYEVVPATGNFFYTHSYTCFYGEPFTHTGFQVTRKINDKLSVFGGWVDGWDSGWANRDGADTFLGGVNLNLSKKTTLAWALTAGHWGTGAAFAGANQGNIYMNSIVLTHKFNDKWTYVLQHDLASNSDNPAGDAQWYGINQYLLRKINDCWSAGGRLEWFRDNDGVRVVPGNAGNYFEATLGVNYKPHSNFLVRPEIRWDWYDGTIAAGNHPFNNGNSDNQFSGGLDMIVTF